MMTNHERAEEAAIEVAKHTGFDVYLDDTDIDCVKNLDAHTAIIQRHLDAATAERDAKIEELVEILGEAVYDWDLGHEGKAIGENFWRFKATAALAEEMKEDLNRDTAERDALIKELTEACESADHMLGSLMFYLEDAETTIEHNGKPFPEQIIKNDLKLSCETIDQLRAVIQKAEAAK